MEEVRDFIMKVYVSDKPFTLTFSSQKSDELVSKDITKIYLYDADFYKKVIDTIINKIMKVYCNGSAEPETIIYNINSNEKLVVEVFNDKHVIPYNINFDVDVTVRISHDYTDRSQILTYLNIKSLYKCGKSIAEIVFKLRENCTSVITKE